MAHDSWYERLEAYLDGELSPESRVAFEEETQASEELRVELNERIRFREETQRALKSEVPQDLLRTQLAIDRVPRPAPRRNPFIPWNRLRPLLALAAVLVLAILAPRLLRNQQGAEGPRSTITIDGPVTALRYGETPHQTTELRAACFDLAAGVCR